MRDHANLGIPLPSGLQVVEHLATAINGLTIQELFNEPENKAGFALFWWVLELYKVRAECGD